MTDTSYANSIELPTDQIFKDMKNAKRFAIDIGGSLAKLAYYSTVVKRISVIVDNPKGSDDGAIYEVIEEDSLQEQLHFIKFETRYIETCVDFIRSNLIGRGEFMQDKVIKVTGGGAHKFTNLFTTKLGVQVDKEDEMECLIKGCNFLLKNITDEAYVFQRNANPEYKFLSKDDNVYPYLLVNIGSGVSILKVESATKYERIGGTSMGGGTFWGLGSILTKAKGFDELLALAEQGDHRNVDMLVKDIYGGAYSLLGLPADVIACSFGKAARCSKEKDNAARFRDADIAKSLLISISNDIGQLASLHAKLHGLTKIYFGGYFIRGHPVTMHTISYAVNYWSKGDIQALFLRHEGYLGAIGAFLKTVEEEDVERYSWGPRMTWTENYAGSSGLQSPKISSTADFNPKAATSGSYRSRSSTNKRQITFDMLELDRFAKPLVSCPLLLDCGTYFPDTDDLTQDTEARDYWLTCFHDAIDKFVEKAVLSQPSKADAEERAKRFKNKYIQRLHELRQSPCAYGSLTVRSLLDTREHCMEEFHFVDPYSQQKQSENEVALLLLPARLASLDAMEWEARQLNLAEGILAGNVFDWGAKEVAVLLEDEQTFGFKEAMDKLPARPWLFDDFGAWLARLRKQESGAAPPHRCCVIFADNSGFDIVLGIFPFAREMLRRGTKVVLCANSRPALNDVTYHELNVLTKRVATMCSVVNEALSAGTLLIMESGQGSPCLDLRAIDYDLAEKMKSLGADLIVLEGMGRALHTNFNAAFNCEALKVAVMKNKWLAKRHGGDMFSIMFKYEPARKVVMAASTSR